MHCPIQNPENANILLDYCARKLSPEATGQLERHFEACPQCKPFALHQQQLWTALDEWETMPVSIDFDRKLYSRIEEFEARSWWRRLLGDRLSWRPAVSFGVACAVLAVAFVINTPYRNLATDSRLQESGKSDVEPEQVERALEDLEMLKQL